MRTHITFVEIAFDGMGTVNAIATITATAKVAADGMRLTAGFGVTAKDLSGNVLFSMPEPQAGSVQATRITA